MREFKISVKVDERHRFVVYNEVSGKTYGRYPTLTMTTYRINQINVSRGKNSVSNNKV